MTETIPAGSPGALLILLLSPAIGSFLTVLIDRLPRGESIVWPGSACRSCGSRLRVADLLPVLSYAIGRGRCRHCGAGIPAWHLYVELAAIGFACLALALGGTVAEVTLTAVILWVLLALAVCDLLWFRLPDGLTAALLLAALAWGTVAAGPEWAHSLAGPAAGAALGSGSFWLIRIAYQQLRGRQGLGMGDVKLMAGLGALAGPWLLPHLVLAAALMALAGAGLQALSGGSKLTGALALPFGAALAAAGALVWLWTRLPL